METWRDIAGYEGKYQVSDLGRVKRTAYVYHRTHLGVLISVPIPEKILGGTKLGSKGYPRVNLNGNFWQIHVLVAKAFVPNPDNKPQVNHKDGVKINNASINLEWVTNQENRDHAVAYGLVASRANGNIGKIPQSELADIYKLRAKGAEQATIARFYGVGQQTISKILKKPSRV